MKYKIGSLCLVVLLVVAAFAVSGSADSFGVRTQQHLETDSRVACTHGDDAFCTHLPIICIDTAGQELTATRVDYGNGFSETLPNSIVGSVTVYDSAEHYNHLADTPVFSTGSAIRYRGHSSIWHIKKNYKLSFLNGDGTENKEYGLLGMEPHDEWALHGPILDRTLIRNYVCLNVIGQAMEYTPDVRFCEVFVDGDYRGLYLAMETVAKGKGRVDISTYEAGDPVSSYLIKSDWYNTDETVVENFTTYTMRMGVSSVIDITYPASAKLTPEIKNYIERDFSRFEKTLYSYDYDDPMLGYKRYLDVSSFVDYAVFNEFFQNYDAGVLSTYYYKDVRGKLHMGPVWDFNNSCDNFKQEITENRNFDVLEAVRYGMLIKDEDFVNMVIARYRELRKTLLSEEYLMNYIDETIAFLGPAIERNNERWGAYMYDPETMDDPIKLAPSRRNPESYEDAVDQLKNFIITRGSWLDAHIETLAQYSHESAVKKFNH